MWCIYNCKQQLHTPPPQSADINVIENLWSMLEKADQKHKITSKDHLKRVLKEEWVQIFSDTTKKLAESMSRKFGSNNKS